MTVENEAKAIENELDATHQLAQVHFAKGDVAAYMEMFADDLVYRMANGVEIGRDQLWRDVEAQMRRLVSVDSSYTRQSLRLEAGGAVEHLVQTASATMRVFHILRRTWRVQRTGRYTWARTSRGWRIRRVEVLDERVAGGAA